eukprot:2165273-Rhodomonas_salina.2
MSGTEIAYGPSGSHGPRTQRALAVPISLRAPYAMSGTAIAYGTTTLTDEAMCVLVLALGMGVRGCFVLRAGAFVPGCTCYWRGCTRSYWRAYAIPLWYKPPTPSPLCATREPRENAAFRFCLTCAHHVGRGGASNTSFPRQTSAT